MEEILKTILKEQPQLISDVVCRALSKYSYIVDEDVEDYDNDYDNMHYEGILVSPIVYNMLLSKDSEIASLEDGNKRVRDLEVQVKTLQEKLEKKDDAFKRLKAQYQKIINEAE